MGSIYPCTTRALYSNTVSQAAQESRKAKKNLLIPNPRYWECPDHLMDSRSLYFSPVLIPLKIYSTDAFFSTASTATTTTEHFKIRRMLWMTVCLQERNSFLVVVTKKGVAAASRWWGGRRGNKTPVGAT